MIDGEGRGLQPDSDQIPKLIGIAKQVGAGVYFGEGGGVRAPAPLDTVHSVFGGTTRAHVAPPSTRPGWMATGEGQGRGGSYRMNMD